jgi:hypothetical protein
MRALLFLFLLAASTARGQVAPSTPQPSPLPEVLLRWAEAQRTRGDVEVDFQQTRTTPALAGPVVTPGRFWHFADGGFRWELGRPAATVLVHDQASFRLREAGATEWRELDAEDPRWRMWTRFLSGREASPEELQRHFLVDAEQQTAEVTAVSLRPKMPMIRRHLRQLDLQISTEGARLVQLRVLQGDGSTLLLTFGPPRPTDPARKVELLAR